MLDPKHLFAFHLGLTLSHAGTRMPMQELATRLNAAGFRTNAGGAYKGGRGTYRFVKCLVVRIRTEFGFDQAAQAVAEAFTRDDGTLAF